MGILSRVSSKTGQILTGSIFDVEFTIEMWGSKGVDATLFPGAPGVTDESRRAGWGGYTKLDMIVPSNFVLQLRPSYYSGGQWGGGAASGFAIDNQWMAVVGGGGGAGYNYLYSLSSSSILSLSCFPGGAGSGGYNFSDPANGEDGSACSGTEPTRDQLFGGRLAAGGGGGAPRGGAASGKVSSCNGFWYDPGGSGGGGFGGGGNIRIYKDQSILDGYLNIFPDVKMTYISHSSGTNNGGGKIKITNKKTSGSIEYFNSIDLKAFDITKI